MVIAQEPASKSSAHSEHLIIDDNLLEEGGLQSTHRATYAVCDKNQRERAFQPSSPLSRNHDSEDHRQIEDGGVQQAAGSPGGG